MARSTTVVVPITDEPEIIESPETQAENTTPSVPVTEEDHKTEDAVEEKFDRAESIYSRGASRSRSRERYYPRRSPVIYHDRNYSPPPRPRGFASRVHEVPILADTRSLNDFIKLDDVCADTATNQMVYIANHPFHNADLDKISWIFKIAAQDTWVHKPMIVATAEGYKVEVKDKEKEKRGRGRYAYDNVYLRYEDTYDAMGRPGTTISRLGHALRVFKSDDKKLGTEKVKFVIAVQGKGNASWFKLVVAHSRQAALVDIFHGIICGHSIQFVGAVLVDVVVPLEGPQKEGKFQKVGSVKEAQEVPSGVIGVIC